MSKVPEFKSAKIVYQEAVIELRKENNKHESDQLPQEVSDTYEDTLITALKSMSHDDVLCCDTVAFYITTYPIEVAVQFNFINMMKYIIDIARDSDYFERKIFDHDSSLDVFDLSIKHQSVEAFCLLVTELKPKLSANILEFIYEKDLLEPLKFYVEEESEDLLSEEYKSLVDIAFKNVSIPKYLINTGIVDLNKEYDTGSGALSVLALCSKEINMEMVNYVLESEQLDMTLDLNGYAALCTCDSDLDSYRIMWSRNEVLELLILLIKHGAPVINDRRRCNEHVLAKLLLRHSRNEIFCRTVLNQILTDKRITEYKVGPSCQYVLHLMIVLLMRNSMYILKPLLNSFDEMNILDKHPVISESITEAAHYVIMRNSSLHAPRLPTELLYVLTSPYIDIHQTNEMNDNILNACCGYFSSKYLFRALTNKLDKKDISLALNSTNVYGLTPLHKACWEDNLEMVDCIVKYSQYIDIKAECKLGLTVIDMALMYCTTDVFKSIVKGFPGIFDPMVMGVKQLAQKVCLCARNGVGRELTNFLYEEFRKYEDSKNISNNVN